MVGVSVADTTLGTTVANLGWDEIRFPSRCSSVTPCAPNRSCTRCGEQSRPGAGIVTFIHRCFNQRNEEVAVCKRLALMQKLPAGAS
jgi:acyl dehydratase